MEAQEQASSSGDGVLASSSDGVLAYREVASALEEVLASSEFRQVEPSPLGRWLGEAWRAFLELLPPVVLEVPRGAGAMVAWLLAGATLALLTAVIGRRMGRLAHRLGRRGKAARGSGSGDGDRPRTPGEWLGLAAARASDGNLRGAATALYQGVLGALDEKGVVRFHPSKTPGEYVAEASAASQAPEATAFIRSFQRFRFGEATPTSAAYRELGDQAHFLLFGRKEPAVPESGERT